MTQRTLLAGIVIACVAAVGLRAQEPSPGSRPEVFHIVIDNQQITPAMARFVDRVLSQAEDAGAVCLVVEINTPGGHLTPTQDIVTRILASRVPVVVYVSPSGGRAASAGLFISLSSHVAAMAPGTRIGAAHPVQFGGLPFWPQAPPEEEPSPEETKAGSPSDQKLVNDVVAWARSLAELRGRNADWAEIAVTQSKVLVTTEALEQNVVELEAANLGDLLEQMDGREVSLQDQTVRISTSGALVRTVDMWWGERLLAVISDPTVVMLLMMFGVYGIMFEFYSPGWGVSGTLGVICLLLAFYGLSVLPVNYVGLALILLALSMFVAEAFVTSFGALTLGGVICLILGGTMLVESPGGFLRVSLNVLIPLALSTAGITVFLVSQVVKTHRGRVQTGSEGLLGGAAVAKEKFVAENGHFRGVVFVHGELWQARSSEPVVDQQNVKIKEREGLILIVEPNEPE